MRSCHTRALRITPRSHSASYRSSLEVFRGLQGGNLKREVLVQYEGTVTLPELSGKSDDEVLDLVRALETQQVVHPKAAVEDDRSDKEQLGSPMPIIASLLRGKFGDREPGDSSTASQVSDEDRHDVQASPEMRSLRSLHPEAVATLLGEDKRGAAEQHSWSSSASQASTSDARPPENATPAPDLRYTAARLLAVEEENYALPFGLSGVGGVVALLVILL